LRLLRARDLEDDELGQRVGLVVHELLENAVRYGDEQELELRLEKREKEIVICVVNTTTDDRALRLRALVDELKARRPPRPTREPCSTPWVALHGERPRSARVRYVGQVELFLTVTRQVTITARGIP